MSKSDLEIDRARRLIDEISANLAELPADRTKYAELRAEVDALRDILKHPDAHSAQVEDRMKSVHGLFDRAADELGADGIRAGTFLKEIGHMLGMH